MIIVSVIISMVVIIISLSVHEFAHAWVADYLGDPTAKNLGRMSLNPIVHIDPIGTIMLPLVLSFTGLGVFGWAKPVPVNLSNLRYPRRDDALVSIAGPASNLMLALFCSVIVRSLLFIGTESDGVHFILFILVSLIRINILLMLFNLLPISPLDGSGVIQMFLSPKALFNYKQLSRKITIVFLAILLLTNWIYIFYLQPVGNVFLRLLQIVAGVQLIYS
ncbi:site-2 protease family protein [bacterium]|nr:site-2 protease family protein [candidate division CSSED10-310 bacterium]